MTFTNVNIDLDTLPRSADVQYRELHPRYAVAVLRVRLMFWVPIFVVATVALFAGPVRGGDLPAVAAVILLAIGALPVALLVWLSFKAARAMRYALREHDVIVRAGLFWKRETLQPIRRIQHIEQHQGPIDKRYGLYELKLFSAGTGYLAFRIPGLDADTASRIRQFILNVQEDGWGADESTEPAAAAAPTAEAPVAVEGVEGNG